MTPHDTIIEETQPASAAVYGRPFNPKNWPSLICPFDRQHLDGFAARHQFKAELFK
jgi:hypothetical protein